MAHLKVNINLCISLIKFQNEKNINIAKYSSALQKVAV